MMHLRIKYTRTSYKHDCITSLWLDPAALTTFGFDHSFVIWQHNPASPPRLRNYIWSLFSRQANEANATKKETQGDDINDNGDTRHSYLWEARIYVCKVFSPHQKWQPILQILEARLVVSKPQPAIQGTLQELDRVSQAHLECFQPSRSELRTGRHPSSSHFLGPPLVSFSCYCGLLSRHHLWFHHCRHLKRGEKEEGKKQQLLSRGFNKVQELLRYLCNQLLT